MSVKEVSFKSSSTTEELLGKVLQAYEEDPADNAVVVVITANALGEISSKFCNTNNGIASWLLLDGLLFTHGLIPSEDEEDE